MIPDHCRSLKKANSNVIRNVKSKMSMILVENLGKYLLDFDERKN